MKRGVSTVEGGGNLKKRRVVEDRLKRRVTEDSLNMGGMEDRLKRRLGNKPVN